MSFEGFPKTVKVLVDGVEEEWEPTSWNSVEGVDISGKGPKHAHKLPGYIPLFNKPDYNVHITIDGRLIATRIV